MQSKIFTFLKNENNFESEILSKLPVEIAILDTSGVYRFVNNNFITETEFAEKLIGQTDEFLYKNYKLDKESLDKRREVFKTVFDKKDIIRFTEKLQSESSTKIQYYKRFYIPFFNKNREITHICFLGNNITAIIHAQKELKYLAYHDKVTGLKNRSAFYEQVQQMIIEQSRQKVLTFSAIIYCDLDNFKVVNDTLGHDAGDFVLQLAAQRMQSCLRQADQIFRIGGDEFTIMIKNLDNGFEAGIVAEKIIDVLSTPFEIGKHAVDYLTVSAGIALYPKDAGNPDELVKAADTAMYKAKSKGKNNFQFASEDLNQDTEKKMQIEKNLRMMVNNNDYENQLKVYYQPIIQRVRSRKMEVMGLEALLRWENKQLGFLRPDIFIKVAEQINVINQLGEWILFKAAHDFKHLKSKNNNLKYISVNISPKQLISHELYDLAKKLLNRSLVRPEQIQFEITESVYLDNRHGEIEKLQSLRELGFHLAIDDFGTGYASLAYLQKIPFNTIKIDRSFISAHQQDFNTSKITTSIIRLAKSLEKNIIAEGVENFEQLQFLTQNKCNQYQGYLFAKPAPINEISKFTDHELKNLMDKFDDKVVKNKSTLAVSPE